MFKQYLKDMKETWKPAAIMHLLCIGINLLTGFSMETIMGTMFSLMLFVLAMWSVYVFILKR